MRKSGGLPLGFFCTLPRPEWTHEAHLAAVSALILEHPKIALDQELRGIISN
jgi:hypothetical protein